MLLIWGGYMGLWAQDLGQPFGRFNLPSPEADGWRLYSISGDAAYYSVGLPYGYGIVPAGVPQQPAWGAGASGAAGWSETRKQSSVQLSYRVSFAAQTGETGFRALNQSLSAAWQHRLRQRWSLNLRASAGVATRDQYLYSYTTTSGDGTAVSATLDEWAAWALSGAFYDSPGAEPLTEALFGYRVLTCDLTAGVTYQESERLSWNFIISGTRLEGLPDGGAAGVQSGGLIASSTAASARFQLHYLLSPRTALTATLAESRGVSRIDDIYATRATAGISHLLTRKWLAEAHAGGSQISPLRTTYSLPADFGYIAGASAGYKSFSNTLLASINRETGDSYGLGAIRSLTGNASWSWRRPGNQWWVQSRFSWQKLNQGLSVEDWTVTAAVNRAFGTHLSTQIAYVYLNFSEARPAGLLPAQSSARASVTWYPRENHR